MKEKWFFKFRYFEKQGLYKDKQERVVELVGVKNKEEARQIASMMWKEVQEGGEFDSKTGNTIRKPFDPRLASEEKLA